MAIKIKGDYAKRLGLPGYSSHQFSVSCETELTDLGQVQGEVARLYELLQDAVDREIVQTGFVPRKDYGAVPAHQNKENVPHNRIESVVGSTGPSGSDWGCSEAQKKLLLTLVEENGIDKDAVDNIALKRFGVGVKELNKLQASGLISELIGTTGKSNGGHNGSKATTRKGGGQ